MRLLAAINVNKNPLTLCQMAYFPGRLEDWRVSPQTGKGIPELTPGKIEK